MNWGPVSKKLQRSHADSNEQSSATGHAIAQHPPVICSECAHIGSCGRVGKYIGAPVVGLDRFGHPEVASRLIPRLIA